MKTGTIRRGTLLAGLAALLCAGLLTVGCDQAPKESKGPDKGEKSQYVPGKVEKAPPALTGQAPSGPLPPGSKPTPDMAVPTPPSTAPVPPDAPGAKPFEKGAAPAPAAQALPGAQAAPAQPGGQPGGAPFTKTPGQDTPAKP